MYESAALIAEHLANLTTSSIPDVILFAKVIHTLEKFLCHDFLSHPPPVLISVMMGQDSIADAFLYWSKEDICLPPVLVYWGSGWTVARLSTSSTTYTGFKRWCWRRTV
jgi:hypothetical protein